MISKKELTEFLNATQEVGNNFNLTQGAGGNTSFKSKESLFIKGSGLKLNESKTKNIFVEVNLIKLKNNLKTNSSDILKNTWDSSTGLKPSIETTMHSIMPQKYVFHLHCLNTISLIVQENFEKKIKSKFKNLNYAIVKYAMPGFDLTKEIQKALSVKTPDVLFLANHGLVVCSNSVNKALKLIYIISNSLDENKRQDLNLDSKLHLRIALNSPYRPTKYEKANLLASSKFSSTLASSGPLFPDQVVFLGPKIYTVKSEQEFKTFLQKCKINKHLPIVIVPKSGVLVPRNISAQSEELVLALSIIISKIPEGTKVNFLRKKDINNLIMSNEEKYRIKINS